MFAEGINVKDHWVIDWRTWLCVYCWVAPNEGKHLILYVDVSQNCDAPISKLMLKSMERQFTPINEIPLQSNFVYSTKIKTNSENFGMG